MFIYISSYYSIYCFVYYILLRILGYSRDILPHRCDNRNFLAYRNSLASHDNRDSMMDARSAGLGGSIGSTKAASAVMSPAGSPPPAAGGGREARLTSDATGGGSGRPLNAPSVNPLTGTSLYMCPHTSIYVSSCYYSTLSGMKAVLSASPAASVWNICANVVPSATGKRVR
jgi:hypothetical protein